MLKTYLILIAATIFEVSGTMLLPVTKGFTKPVPTGALIFFYVCAFFCLSIVVTKLPISNSLCNMVWFRNFYNCYTWIYFLRTVFKLAGCFGDVLNCIGINACKYLFF